MSENNQDVRILLLMVLLAAWAVVYGYSIYFLLTVSPQGDGVTRGLNRISGFLGWQGLAGIIAFACWGIGWAFARSSSIRRISAVPMAMALALLMVMVGMVLFSG